MLDALAEEIPVEEIEEDENSTAKIAIIGQPNVGKSSMVNALIGEDRNIVTDIAGTTRDSIHTNYNLYGRNFILIDTAGIRKKSVKMDNLEFYSVIRAIKAIDECDVCMLMIDAKLGIESQDLKILRLAEQKKKGIIILVNKWDLIEDKATVIKDQEAKILDKIAPFTDIPILFVSAVEKIRVMKAIDTAIAVHKKIKTKIATSELNEYLQEVIELQPPPSIKGKYIKIKYVTQLPTPGPTFAFFVNLPQYIKSPYKNFLENKIRKKWDFTGVPIRLVFRKKN